MTNCCNHGQRVEGKCAALYALEKLEAAMLPVEWLKYGKEMDYLRDIVLRDTCLGDEYAD